MFELSGVVEVPRAVRFFLDPTTQLARAYLRDWSLSSPGAHAVIVVDPRDRNIAVVSNEPLWSPMYYTSHYIERVLVHRIFSPTSDFLIDNDSVLSVIPVSPTVRRARFTRGCAVFLLHVVAGNAWRLALREVVPADSVRCALHAAIAALFLFGAYLFTGTLENQVGLERTFHTDTLYDTAAFRFLLAGCTVCVPVFLFVCGLIVRALSWVRDRV